MYPIHYFLEKTIDIYRVILYKFPKNTNAATTIPVTVVG